MAEPAEKQEPPLTLVKTIEGLQVEAGKVRTDFVVKGLPADDGEFDFVFVAKVASLDLAQPSNPMPATLKPDAHVISVEMKGIGGTPLAGERVVVVDPDSGETVGDPVEADDRGKVVAIVPEAKKYDLRVIDDDDGEPANEDLDFDKEEQREHAVLFCQIIGADGRPAANQGFRLRGEGGATFDVRSDAEGRFDLMADPGAYELEVSGKKYFVHTLHPDDLAADPAPYRLALGGARAGGGGR